MVRVVEEALEEKRTVFGIECTIVLVKEWENDALVEETRAWYTQDILGNVWSFGEEVNELENGEKTGHEGAWEEGMGNASTHPFMKDAIKLYEIRILHCSTN